MARHEREIALFGTRRGPAKVVRRRSGLAILPDAQKRYVEIVTGEVEVVRIATEESNRELGREDEPDVLMAAVFIEVKAATLVQADDVTAYLVGRGTLLLY